jgi:putative drug exporter of the RND superfamily
MELPGGVNWWFPRWLDRIVPVLDVEGDPDDEGTPTGSRPLATVTS